MHFKSTKHQIFFSVTAINSCSPALLKMSKRKSGIFWRRGRRLFYSDGCTLFFQNGNRIYFFKV